MSDTAHAGSGVGRVVFSEFQASSSAGPHLPFSPPARLCLEPRLHPVWIRIPEVTSEIHAAIQGEAHAFVFQQAALGVRVADAEVRAAGPPALDHPVARHPGPAGGAVHRPADDPGRSPGTEQLGDLPVRRHLPPRDLGDEGVDSGKEALRPSPRAGAAPAWRR